ncbi:rod shape-determining protein MreD [Ulvibacter litoralis]|uniref:Rod shape-determining protein MreD n=1 Tax=Ulvibacter litoralis TaxID=227084 RepID=A0A1G7CFP5_9FLAO|nr:rod shape-determining protein MreD [Ulvibacter litoralis]GHC47730.1 rod shape-determining protein MreD [Ulvibacter litoralis]SDE37516.1 rod shape-determining protein MreD [Ulvibacter litoralis]
MNNSEIISNVFRFIILVLLQVLILNNINFLGYINPYLYILFIIVFPLNGNKSLLIILSFLLGLSIDLFGNSGGIHAAACLVIAYLRPLFLKFSFGVSYEYNMVKVNKAPLTERITYITLMVLLHHLILFSLEIFSFSHILLLLKSTLFSSIFSIVLVFCTLLLFSRKS